MTQCGWCERIDNLTSLEVEPARTALRRADDGTLIDVQVRAPVYAWACPEHAAVTFDLVAPVEKIRRRKARGFQQLSLLGDDVQPAGRLHRGRDPDAA